MVVGEDEGSRERGKSRSGWGYSGKCVIASGRIAGFGVWFVLFRTYRIEERSYMSLLLSFTLKLKIGPATFFAIAVLLARIFSRYKGLKG